MTVTPAEFSRRHGLKLERWRMRARAEKIFTDFGPHLSWKLDTLFERSLEHSKVAKVVNMLEEEWEERLVHLEPLIQRPVACMLAIDNAYARHFRDVIERMIPGATFIE